MGLAYTIDTPIKVARFGISSVVSIIEDALIERMREHYYKQQQQHFIPISINEPDYRAKRITDYLNLMNKIVHEQFEKLKTSAFEKGSELIKYFDMLPDNSQLKQLYVLMTETKDERIKKDIQKKLLQEIQPGSIDVNIMTKVDRNQLDKAGQLVEDGSDALTSLRAYANSNLKNSSVVFSAGMNPRLYNYLERLDVFNEKTNNAFHKKIIIKVSDYRSALIQGKYLAKKGIWVSEFRIESGLNCGGHAFATDGFLMGPILEEFKNKRKELIHDLFETYTKALTEKGKEIPTQLPELKITAQGGIGTHDENELLLTFFEMDATGWGSPFLLVPEATTVDEKTLQQLCNANEKDIILSKNSPLGVRFNYLKNISGEVEKFDRIKSGKPGSPCTEKFLQSNTEFTNDPICTASVKYQKLKLNQLATLHLSGTELNKQLIEVLDKECLCLGLSNSALQAYHSKPLLNKALGVTICPGPNMAYFNKVSTLKEMTDHIYGRKNLLRDGYRPHFFIKELQLYVTYLQEQIKNLAEEIDKKTTKYYQGFCSNLLDGINYYKQKSNEFHFSKNDFISEISLAENSIQEVLNTITTKSEPILA
jgi:hypothetical protein